MMRIGSWLQFVRDMSTLYRLARRRIRSEQDYRSFQAFQGGLLVDYLHRHGVTLAGKLVVDLGSGIGGYAEEMARRGARVLAVDLMAHAVSLQGCTQITASALAAPVPAGCADVVFCASLIEHLAEPDRLLAEIKRLLTPGGVCYLSFPPFFSPVGGHEYAPFHYLGERMALRLARRRSRKAHPEWAKQLYPTAEAPDSFAGLYRDWGLYIMTIGKAQRLIRRHGLAVLDRSTRYLPFGFDGWPVVGEFLTWHVQFLLYKPVIETTGAPL